MNNVSISGRSWEVDCRYANNGTCISQFGVSVYNGKGQDGKAKYFSVGVKCFKELAENVGNSIKKGDYVTVSGRLDLEQWEKDGQKHSRMVIIADTIGKEVSKFTQTGANSFGSEVLPGEEIPF